MQEINWDIYFYQFKQGDQRAFTKLFDKYKRPVFCFVENILNDPQTSEDIVVESFLKAWQHRHSLESTTHFYRFVFKVARNKCLNILEKQQVEISTLDGLEIADDRNNELFEDLLISMWKGVDKLPEYLKEVVVLRVKHDMSYQAISEKLNLKISTLYEYYKCGLQKLRTNVKRI